MQALRETDPRRIGPYAVLGRLGAGGMGEVYLAEAGTGGRLAVKVVRAEHAEDRTFRARFRQEVRAAQTVGGAGRYVARVVDADTEGERPWMATEFVDGPNLRDAVLDHGPLPTEAVRLLAAALCEALSAIHAQGMVHRDLKPSNILLAPDGPRVIDFGIVRALEATALTRTGTVVGSVGYVSPEQIRNNGQVGPPSDVFALGAVLAYAAGGREPFGEGKDAVVLMRIMTRDFDLSGVPEDLRRLVEPCLREEPGARPTPAQVAAAAGHTARSLRESLRSGWFTAAARPAGGGEEPERWLPERDSGERESRVEYFAPVTVTDLPSDASHGPSRRRLLQGLGAGALLAAGAGTGGWLWLRDRGGGEPRGETSASPSYIPPPVQPTVVAWQRDTGGLHGEYDHRPCVSLSPGGDTVYVAGEDASLYALTPDGRVRWKSDIEGMGGPPLATRDGVYCMSIADLYAFDTRGRLRWKRRWDVSHGLFTYPVAAGDLVLVAAGSFIGSTGVRAYRPDGSTAWQTRTDTPTVPPLVANGVVHVGTRNGQLIALDAKTGKQLWSAVRAGAELGLPALVRETLVVGSVREGAVHGIGPTGKTRWQRITADVGTGAINSVGSESDRTYTPLRGLAVTTGDGRLVAIDPADGSTAWTFRGRGATQPFGEPTVHGGLAYVCLGRTLYAVDERGQERLALDLTGLETVPTHRPVPTVHPVYGAYIYLGTSSGIVALELPV